jgi:hypothetical protein
LKYAYEDEVGWHTTTVDNQGSVGQYSSLALDAAGFPHISYLEFTNRELMYAYEDGDGWHIELAATDVSVALYSSLALDSSGFGHISYFDFTNYDLKYAFKDITGWHIETADGQGLVGKFTSLALDDAGYPHISYYARFDSFNEDLKYAYKDSSGWHTMTVDSQGNVGYFTSLALDTSGRPHISYHDWANGDLKYAHIQGIESLNLTCEITADTLYLTWTTSDQVNNYWIYGAPNLPWFLPGFAPGYKHRLDVLPASSTTWSSAAGVSDPYANWSYLVIGVDALEEERARSNRGGEHDFECYLP